MGVYFALRTHYDYPTGKYLRYFPEDDSVLEWFQRHWQGRSDEDSAKPGYGYEILGCSVYGFDSLFEAIAEHELTPPKTMRQLSALLNEHLYVEGEILTSANALQVLTDDDELELAYYFFDDHFIVKHPEKAAYLLHDNWELPSSTEAVSSRLPSLPIGVKTLPNSGKGAGAVYTIFLSFYDSSNLSDLDGTYRIPGIRLTDLMNYLRGCVPNEDWVVDLQLLRALTAVPQGAEKKELQDVLTEASTIPVPSVSETLYKLKFGKGSPAEDRAKMVKALAKIDTDYARKFGKEPLLQMDEHIAQLSFHTSTWYTASGDVSLYYRWILFDDVWFRAHPALGHSILRFGTRWDVLT